ncbi:MAG: hypothetical protein IJW40_03975 [Clostridia bacterium]|nr:hypothetical protein [Clostridia bacterium]
MFYNIYKTTLKTLLRSRTAWLALLLILVVLINDVMQGHYGYYDLTLQEMIYDTDYRYVLEYDIYRNNVLQNTASASMMNYPLPLFAVICVVVVLTRDFVDRYFEIEKAGNIRPISYYLARLLGIMTIVTVVSVGATLLTTYWYILSRGGVSGFSFGEIFIDSFPRLMKYVFFMMVPVLLALVAATLCLGNLFRSALLAALGGMAYIVANYLYCYIGNITGWKPYFDYFSTSPEKLRWYIAAFDRINPEETLASMNTSLSHALVCIGIAVGAALLYSVVSYLRIRKREI